MTVDKNMTGKLDLKMIEVASEERSQEKIGSGGFFELTARSAVRTMTLAVVAALSALILTAGVGLLLKGVLVSLLVKFYQTGLEGMTLWSNNPILPEFSVQDVILFFHLQTGTLDIENTKPLERAVLSKPVAHIQYVLGILPLLSVPVLSLMLSTLCVRRWLNPHESSRVVFMGTAVFIYALSIGMLAVTASHSTEVLVERQYYLVHFQYQIWKAFGVAFLCGLGAITAGFHVRRRNQAPTNPVYEAMTMISRLWFLVFVVLLFFSLFFSITGYDGDSKVGQALSGKEAWLIAPIADIYVLANLFMGRMELISITPNGSGLLEYSLFDGIQLYGNEGEFGDMVSLLQPLANNTGAGLLMKVALLIPIILLLIKGKQLAATSRGLWNHLLFSISFAVLLSTLGQISSLGWVLQESNNFFETTTRLDGLSLTICSFLFCLIFTSIGGLLYFRRLRK